MLLSTGTAERRLSFYKVTRHEGNPSRVLLHLWAGLLRSGTIRGGYRSDREEQAHLGVAEQLE